MATVPWTWQCRGVSDPTPAGAPVPAHWPCDLPWPTSRCCAPTEQGCPPGSPPGPCSVDLPSRGCSDRTLLVPHPGWTATQAPKRFRRTGGWGPSCSGPLRTTQGPKGSAPSPRHQGFEHTCWQTPRSLPETPQAGALTTLTSGDRGVRGRGSPSGLGVVRAGTALGRSEEQGPTLPAGRTLPCEHACGLLTTPKR